MGTIHNITAEFTNKNRVIVDEEFSSTINPYLIYEEERNKCNDYELTATIKPYCSNVLSNPVTEIVGEDGNVKPLNGKELIDVLYNIDSSSDKHSEIRFGLDVFGHRYFRNKTSKMADKLENLYPSDICSLEEAIAGNIIEENGWVGFRNKTSIFNKDKVIVKDVPTNSFVDLFPNRDYFTFFHKNREQDNWDVFLTYPAEEDHEHELIRDENGINGIKILSYEINPALIKSGSDIYQYICITTEIKHGLQVGDEIEIDGFTDVYGQSVFRVWQLGDVKDFGNKEYCFYIRGNFVKNREDKIMVPYDIVVNFDYDDASAGHVEYERYRVQSGRNFIFKMRMHDGGGKKTPIAIRYLGHNYYINDGSNDIIKFQTDEATGIVTCTINSIEKDSEDENVIIQVFFKTTPGDNNDYNRASWGPGIWKTALLLKNHRLRRIVNNVRSKYYLRKFKKINTNFAPYVYPLGFSQTLYNDTITQIQYPGGIHLDGLKDNKGCELKEIYLTIIKNNCNGVFTDIISGIEKIDYETKYNIHTLVNNSSKGESNYLENGISSEWDCFYGDIVEYNDYEAEEKKLDDIYHRFNTKQREYGDKDFYSGYVVEVQTSHAGGGSSFLQLVYQNNGGSQRSEGYYYKAHYKIPIKTISTKTYESFSKEIPICPPILLDRTQMNLLIEVPNTEGITKTTHLRLIQTYKGQNRFFDVYPNNITNKVITITKPEEITDSEDYDYRLQVVGEDVPDYATPLENGAYRWKKICELDDYEGKNPGKPILFNNGYKYLNLDINFFLRRQDPHGEYGLLYRGLYGDVASDDFDSSEYTNFKNGEEIC